MDKYIGTKLKDRYEITEHIGSGGMADVYKAIDTLTDMTVAVKILKEEFLEDGEIRKRFSNEAKAIAILNHKNIVKVYAVSGDDYLQYIVMEYVNGITLKEYINQQGVLSWKEATHFTTQILKGLKHAHSKGIIHRDVKPQNIMLLENGDIKITDFGIARILRDERRNGQNRQKQTMGSVHYIAPEQARGAAADERADIYSVGVMLYEMLTGVLPFDGDDTVSVAVMQMQADPRLPTAINPSIPEGLEEITMQAMQKDPAERYQNTADMLMDLDDFKRNPDIHFDYRYTTDNSPTRYINAVYNARRRQEEASAKREKSPIIPVLTGITSAFVIVALVMVWLVLDESGIFMKNASGASAVPDFIGKNYEEIISNTEYTYQFLIEWSFSNDYAENKIMNQTPKPGRTVYKNATVTLTVSKGIERLLVPDFEGFSYAEYSEQCIKLNLVPKEVLFYNDAAEGTVVNTNPLPRTDIKEGEVVEIFVSQGKKPEVLLMPNCQNLSETEARAKLAAMGITSTSVIEMDSEKPAGTILAQTPAAGSVISEELTTVTFTISNGKAPKSKVKISIPLPDGLYSTSLRIEILIDNETVVTDSINTNEKNTYETEVESAGSSREVKVYLAGQLYETLGINFTTGEVKSTKINPDYTVPTTAAPAPTEPAVTDTPAPENNENPENTENP